MSEDSLLEVIRDDVFSGEKPAKAVAEEIGKPYRTLMRELNDADEGAKLGVDMLIPIMNSTGSLAPLRYLAHRMKHRLVSMANPVPDKQTLAEECMDDYPSLVALHRALESGASESEIAAKKHALFDEIEQSIAKALEGRPDGQVLRCGRWEKSAGEEG